MPIKLPSFRSRRDAYPPDLWTKCPSCSEMLFNKQLEKTLRVCPSCGHHFRLSASARLELLLDAGTFEEHDPGLVSVDALGFVDQKPYPDRIAAAQVSTGLRDAAVWGFGKVDGTPVAICVLDFGFMGGSMGAVVGEKVARAAEGALDRRVPLVVVSASGGARMQEGTIALMQLAKTMATIERLRAAEVPFISIMSDPTTGGVFASYAAVGDVNLAEPNALIGFAGARVSAGTIAAELPPGFQRSEFLFEHGFVDRVVARADLRDELARLLRYLVAPARETAVAEATEAAAFSFRPLSVLSGIRDRVLPDDLPRLSNGRGSAGLETTAAAEPVQLEAGSVPAEPAQLAPAGILSDPDPTGTASDPEPVGTSDEPTPAHPDRASGDPSLAEPAPVGSIADRSGGMEAP